VGGILLPLRSDPQRAWGSRWAGASEPVRCSRGEGLSGLQASLCRPGPRGPAIGAKCAPQTLQTEASTLHAHQQGHQHPRYNPIPRVSTAVIGARQKDHGSAAQENP